jgi:hypothetical protein
MFKACIAVLLLCEDDLMYMSFDNIFVYMKNFSISFGDEGCVLPCPEDFIAKANEVKISERKLALFKDMYLRSQAHLEKR